MLRQEPAESVLTKELQRVCAELERRLGAGDSCSAESVFFAHPELSADADAALEVIYTEFVAREHLGQRPAPDDFCTRFPQWRDGLEQLFQIHLAVGDKSAVVRSSRGISSRDAESSERSASGPSGTPFPQGEDFQRAGFLPRRDGQDGSPNDRRRVGNYELLEEIGRGGMGVVYKARQVGLNRVVAVKMILAGADAGPQERTRFRAEAEAAARLQHPNIVQIHEVGEHDGRPFLSLEFVDGGSLEVLTGKPWPPVEAARLVQTLASAMHHAHQQGVVHRDLKPANVLVRGEGREVRAEGGEDTCRLLSPHVPGPSPLVPKITDFGLARRLRSADTVESAGTELTATGAILGTPAYMAPEQAMGDGREIGPAADVYALGAILYELLTGRPPFQGVSVLETLEQVRTRDPLPPSGLLPALPRDLETVCLKCLRKEPGQRYASAAELADDLGRFLRGEPVRARPTPAWEKIWKWAKRRPTVAALLAALVILTIIGLTSVTLLWRQTAAALHTVKTKHEETEAALASKLVALAQRDWLANDLDAARRYLDECPPAHRGPEWRHWHRLCHACLVTLGKPDPQEKITSLAWNPDGSRVASNHAYHRGKLWDPATQADWSLKLEQMGFFRIAFTSDGLPISLGRKTPRQLEPAPVEVRIWDPKTQQLVREFTTPPALDQLAVSRDGRRLAIADKENYTIIDVHSGAVVTNFAHGCKGAIATLALSADGRLVACGDLTTLRVNDADTGKLARHMFWGRAVSAAFSPDGGRLAVVKFDQSKLAGDAEIYEIFTGKQRKPPITLRGHTSLITTLAFSPDGRRLATAGGDKIVMIWDADTGKELFTFRGHLAPVNAVAFSPDGTRLASGSSDGTVRIWDVRPFDERTD